MTFEELEERIRSLLGRMTLEEKVGQLHQASLYEGREALEEGVRSGAIGSVVLAYTPFAGAEDIRDAVGQRKRLSEIALRESRLGIPLLLGRDVVHGHRTVFPIPLAQAAAWDPPLARRASSAAADEAMDEGVNWAFAPVADLARDPRWGRIVEGYGEDPLLCGEYAASAVQGFQSSGAFSACVKHFIGYGASEGGRDYSGADISPSALEHFYLPPFAAAVSAGADSVMASFNDVNGIPVTAANALLTGLLKERLGFKGFVVSDWDGIGQLIAQGVAADRREAARLAFEAGVDVDMCSGCYRDHLAGLIRSGVCSETRLDDAVRRVLRVKLLRHGSSPVVPRRRGDARALAKKFAAQSMVLLKNDGALLPLRLGGRVALIGSVAAQRRIHLGSWTLDGRAEETRSIAEALAQRRPVRTVPDDQPDAARQAALCADVAVVVLGEDWNHTGEARGSALLQLPEQQLLLLERVAEVCPHVVAVVCGGRPLCLGRVEACARSILLAWHGGSEAAAAIADVLCGEAEPGGRLPVTLPRHAGQIPLYYNQRPAARAIDDYYGDREIRSYQDCPASPLYPFGWGLGYTQFSFGAVAVEQTRQAVRASCAVRNTGARTGETVCQCYVQGKGGVVRPVRELKAFRRIRLSPGEETQVEFLLTESDLVYRDASGAVRSERYRVWIGESSLARNAADFVWK